MADYHAILKRAIGALPEPTGEARRSVYEKARAALITQLKSFNPPLSAAEITQQRLQLEDSIRRVEAEAAKGILSQTLNRVAMPTTPPIGAASQPPAATSPATASVAPTIAPSVASQGGLVQPQPRSPIQPSALASPSFPQPASSARPSAPRLPTPIERPRPSLEAATRPISAPPPTAAAPASQLPPPQTSGSDAIRRAIDDADRLGAATAESARQAKQVMSATVAAGTGTAGLDDNDRTTSPTETGRRPTKRRDRTETRRPEAPPTPRVESEPARRSRIPLLAGLVVAALVIAIGVAALWTNRDDIASYLGSEQLVNSLPTRIGVAPPPPPKSVDRLATDDSATGRVAASGTGQNGVKSVPTQPIMSQPDVRTGIALDERLRAGQSPQADTNSSSTSYAPVDSPALSTLPATVQKATLLEEGTSGGAQNAVTAGRVVWQTVRESPQPGKPQVTMVKARIEVPERGLTLNVTIQPNTDSSFPASHLVELRFQVSPDFDNKGVSNVPGLIMKATEQARGDPLAAASARISSGFFWIALAAPEPEKSRNITLLKERGWIDIPILYENNRRAILTIEKAGAGDRVVADALTAWGQGG